MTPTAHLKTALAPWSYHLKMKKYLFLLSIVVPSLSIADSFEIDAGEEKICTEFVKQLNQQMGFSSLKSNEVTKVKRTFPEQKIRLPKEINEEPMIFDFDNDGVDDLVLEFNDWRRYITGSIVYVAYSKGNSEVSEIDISDINVFPCQFSSDKPKSSDCPTFSQNADGAGIDFSLKEHKVHFRGRYTDINLRTYNGDNYLQLFRTYKHPYKKHYAGIIKVKNKTEFTPVCLFSKK